MSTEQKKSEPVGYVTDRFEQMLRDGHVGIVQRTQTERAPHPIYLGSPPADKLIKALQEASKAEFFEDGLSADLHMANITTLPAAYLAGRNDLLAELLREAGGAGQTTEGNKS